METQVTCPLAGRISRVTGRESHRPCTTHWEIKTNKTKSESYITRTWCVCWGWMICGREPRTKGIIVVVIELIITQWAHCECVSICLNHVSTCMLPLRLTVLESLRIWQIIRWYGPKIWNTVKRSATSWPWSRLVSAPTRLGYRAALYWASDWSLWLTIGREPLMMNKGMDLAAVQPSLCTQVTDVTESKVTDCQTLMVN